MNNKNCSKVKNSESIHDLHKNAKLTILFGMNKPVSYNAVFKSKIQNKQLPNKITSLNLQFFNNFRK